MTSPLLENGTRIRTERGRNVRVIDHVRRASQKDIYRVECGGRQLALKWFDKNAFGGHRLDDIRDSLRRQAELGPLGQSLLWPLDVTREVNGSFGYLEELVRPEEYADLLALFRETNRFPSMSVAIDACLDVVSAFRRVHEVGYSFQAVNYETVLVDPRTGRVLVVADTNVLPEGAATWQGGPHVFMAPERAVNYYSSATVRAASDLHSIAAIVFRLLLRQDPLFGKRYESRPSDVDWVIWESEIYGSNPLFVFDPDDTSNGLTDDSRGDALRLWPILPERMRAFFCRAFSQEALHDPSKRPSELEWMRELVLLRSELVRCSCGTETFRDGAKPIRCTNCGRMCECKLRIDVGGVQIPIEGDVRIHRCQLKSVRTAKEALDQQLLVTRSPQDPAQLLLRNVSGHPWYTELRGRVQSVNPGQSIQATDGLGLSILGRVVRIHKNDQVDPTTRNERHTAPLDEPVLAAGEHLTLDQAVSLALGRRGGVALSDAHVLLAFALDYMDQASPELRVLQNCCEDKLLAPFSEAWAKARDLEGATREAFDWLREQCYVAEEPARIVVEGIAHGIRADLQRRGRSSA